MSLYSCNQDSIFCNMDDERNFIKIIYNKLDNNTDYNENISQYKIIINEIKKNINNKIVIDQEFKKLEELYVKPPQMTQHKFIFVGQCDKQIETEFKKIENEREITADFDIGLVANYFGLSNDNLINEIGELKDYKSIKFIYHAINANENLNIVYSLISNYLSCDGDIFHEELTYLYGKHSEIESNLIKQQLKEDYINKNFSYNEDTIKKHLNNFFVPNKIIEDIIDKYKKNDINNKFNQIIDEYVITKFIENTYKFRTIGYTLKKNNIDYNQDSYIFKYLEDSTIQDNYQEDITGKNIGYQSHKKNTINQYKVENNTFYLYNLFNINEYLTSKKLINNDNIYFNKFYKKFFYKLKDKDLSLYTNKDVKEKKTKQQNYLNNYNRIMSSYFRYNKNTKNNNIKISLDKTYLVNIKHSIILPRNFDLLDIFNDVRLSLDIPFVKIRDFTGTKDVVYKLLKEITSKRTYKHRPLLSKEILNSWIKNSGYEFTSDILRELKNSPKELSYKLKITDIRKKNILIGKIFRVNIDSFDIEYNNIIIENIPKSHITEHDGLEINSSVKFFDIESIYADVNISRKKYMNIVLDISKLEKYNIAENIDIIITKVNEFINKIYSIDSLTSYKELINLVTIGDLYKLGIDNESRLLNFIYKYNVSLPNDVYLNYDDLYKISTLLYPLVIINQTPFNKDDKIEFFLSDTQKWVEGTIKNYSLNNTYDIEFKNAAGVKVDQTVERQLIRQKEDKDTYRMFELLYKKIPDFDDNPPIQNLIVKLKNVGKSNPIIIDEIMQLFNIPYDDASDIVVKILNKLPRLDKLEIELGISIKFNYIPHLLKNSNYIEVYIENIKSFKQISEIYKLVSFYFDLYSTICVKKEKNTHFNNLQSEYEDVSPIEVQNIEDNIIIDESDDLGFSLSDSEDEDEDENEDEDEYIDEDMDREDDNSEQLEKLKNEINKESTLFRGKKPKNIFLDKLVNTDDKLFNWNIEGSRAYSSTCQAGRYPIPLTDDEKKEIDKTNPYSYATHKNDIDCKVSEDIKEYSKKNTKTDKVKCKSIWWGSSEEDRRWYICPRIFDIKLNKPLTTDDLDYESIEGKKFTPMDSTDTNNDAQNNWKWRTDKNTEKDILEYKPSSKDKPKRFLTDDINKINEQNSIFINPKKTNYSYPGFLRPSTSGKEIYVPCCFNDYSKEVNNAFKTKIIGQKDVNNYIQGWGKIGKELGFNPVRIGLLPDILQEHFPKELKCSTGNISISNKCFLRKGIMQGNNSFLNLISDMIKVDQNIEDSYDIVDTIVRKLDEKTFKQLNFGNLYNQFKNVGKQSSFQNFLEYTLSDQYKDYSFYYDLLIGENSILEDKSFMLIIFDYSYNDTVFNIDVLCPHFCNIDLSLKRSVYFAIKYNNIFEPIYLFNKSVTSFTKKFSKSDSNISNIVSQFENNCASFIKSDMLYLSNKILNFNLGTNYVSLDAIIKKLDEISIQNENYKPLNLFRDNYNKVIGIYLKNKVVVPVYPQVSKRNNIIDLKERDGNYDLADLSSVIDTYQTLKLKSNGLIDISVINTNKKDDKVVGYLTNLGIYLPVKSINNEIFTKLLANYKDVDDAIYTYEKQYYSRIYKPKNNKNILQIINELAVKNTKYEINKVITDDEISTEKLVLECDIVIHIENLKLAEIKNIYKKDKEYKTINNFENIQITNLDNYIQNAIELSRLSDYRIDCLPVRAIMDENKIYTHIILETGLNIRIAKEEQFKIFEKKDGKYKILDIIENPIIDKLFTNRDLSQTLFIDDQIKNIKKIKYTNNILEIIRYEMYNFLIEPNYIEIKQYLLRVIDNKILTVRQKKYLLAAIFNLIMECICKVDTTNTQYPILDIKNSCSKYDCKLDICEKDIIKQNRLSDINEFKTLTNNILKNPKNVSVLDSKTIKEALNMYNLLVEKTENVNLCRTKLIDNIEFERYSYIKNLILNEIIRNNYKKRQILVSYKRIIDKERYKSDNNLELILTGRDLTASILNDLYTQYKRKYYRDSIPFENQEINIDYKADIFNNDECQISDITKGVIVKSFISKLTGKNEYAINRNKSINSNIVTLNNREYSNLYAFIMNKNTNITSCEVDRVDKIKYQIQHGLKKKLV